MNMAASVELRHMMRKIMVDSIVYFLVLNTTNNNFGINKINCS